MDLEIVKSSVRNQWQAQSRHIVPFHLSGEAKFVTGKPHVDMHLHYLETVAGLEILLSEDFMNIVGYNVIDSEKFTWFVLRWA